MSQQERITLCGQRYRQRRDSGTDGWACDESYPSKVRRAEALIAKYGVPKGARFLELGCGAGNVALHMAKCGFESYGIDVVPEAIEWANANADREGVKATFYLGTVARLDPFEPDVFDVVFDGDCLWMVLAEDRQRCFANVHRVLKPGGIFLAKAHIVSNEFSSRHDIAQGVWIDPTTLQSTVNGVPMYQYSREDEFLAELMDTGLEVCEHRNESPDDADDQLPPFCRGVVVAEARKPERSTANKNGRDLGAGRWRIGDR